MEEDEEEARRVSSAPAVAAFVLFEDVAELTDAVSDESASPDWEDDEEEGDDFDDSDFFNSSMPALEHAGQLNAVRMPLFGLIRSFQ